MFVPCYHDETSKCSFNCHYGGRCEASCVCGQKCTYQNLGCNCTGTCNKRTCPCYAENRVCEKGKCKNCYLGKNSCLRKSTHFKNIKYNLVIGVSDISGWGLYTLNDIPAGEFVREYIGEYLTNDEEIDKRGKLNKLSQLTYMFGLVDQVTIDSMYMGNKTRFANHSNKVNIDIKVSY